MNWIKTGLRSEKIHESRLKALKAESRLINQILDPPLKLNSHKISRKNKAEQKQSTHNDSSKSENLNLSVFLLL